MSKIENLLDIAKLNELLGRKQEEEEKACRKVVWVLAIIGAIAAVAAIAYAVYRYLNPHYLEDFEDEFEDDFEDEDEETGEEEDDFFVDEGEN